MPTMTMSEKIELSRTNARHALDAYRELGGVDPDDQAAICDLITDLLHLSEVVEVSGPLRDSADLIAFRALDHVTYESDPANADEEV